MIVDAPLVEYTRVCMIAALKIVGSPRDELGPKRTGLAWDIASSAFVEPPLWPDDVDRHRTVRTLVAIAARESSIRNDVHGLGGECTMFQIKPRFLGLSCGPLESDAQAATHAAMRIIRLSQSMCKEPRAWLNSYAAGPGACDSTGAQRISDDRAWLADEIEKQVGP